jgi:hypothetical protein
MTPERIQQIQELYNSARDRAPVQTGRGEPNCHLILRFDLE